MILLSDEGQYGEWSPWSDCSQTCSGGERSRYRSHSCLSGIDTQLEACGSDGDYLPW